MELEVKQKRDFLREPEEKNNQLNSMLRIWREINFLIQRETNPLLLLNETADLLRKYRNYNSVWFYLFGDEVQSQRILFSGDKLQMEQIRSLPLWMQEDLKNSPYFLTQTEILNTNEGTNDSHNINHLLMISELNHGENAFGIFSVSLENASQHEQEERIFFEDIAKVISFALSNIELQAIRTSMELALRTSEIKFRRLFEHSNDAIFLHDINGYILDANGKAAELIGLPREELLKLNLFQLFPNSIQQDITKSLSDLEKDQYFECEVSFENVDGILVDGELNEKFFDAEKGIIQAILRDITNQKWAEEALESNLTLLQTLLETIPNPIFYKDANGVYLGCNRRLLQLHGTSQRSNHRKNCQSIGIG
jgi:PAS domain S-box-containing protein